MSTLCGAHSFFDGSWSTKLLPDGTSIGRTVGVMGRANATQEGVGSDCTKKPNKEEGLKCKGSKSF